MPKECLVVKIGGIEFMVDWMSGGHHKDKTVNTLALVLECTGVIMGRLSQSIPTK